MRTIWTFSFILTSLYITIFATLHHHGTGKYTNTWVVEVIDDHPDTVRKVTEELDLHYHGPVGSLKNIHVVQHKTLESGLNRTSDEHHKKIVVHDKVLYARQEQILNRKKRGYIRSDPDYKKQWFLKNTGQTRHLCNGELYDINVEPVWREGITGRGVVVAILDDGLEYTHPDLKRNFNNVSSFNFNSRPYSRDPIPRETPDDLNKHGTRCAGEVAAERDNGVCGRGVAYNAQVAGIRMLDGEVSDAIEAGSLSYRRDLIDIYSSSWGPDDDGYTVDGPGRLTRRALSEGISKGRNGLGSIFVWATGNGGGLFDYCSCDGYINSPYTISIGAVNNCGHKPWYSEPCPGTLAVTFSSGETSRERRDLQIVTTDLHKKCTDLHTGTSAAAPLAAGIFALVLEANPKLTWRDLQHLIVHTSRKVHPSDSGWKENGAGLIVNENFGFGSLDAKALVDAARDPNWKQQTHGRFTKRQSNMWGYIAYQDHKVKLSVKFPSAKVQMVFV
ncbi:neuroendocrine convertase 1-like [Clytia hemisphaerica]|uniref:Uncharacterized protein n=1 Tax=Clytia hemisphaerica TaxID=252671 RepID=A0A7M5VBS4_9CNID